MRRFLPALAVLAALVAAACSAGGSGGSSGGPVPSPSGGSGEQFVRDAQAGGIEVEATWLTKQEDAGTDVSAYPLDSFVLIRIGFTTHSGNLNSIDMVSAARLKQAGAELIPEKWVVINNDSHHRAGVLVFPRRLQRGAVHLVLKLGENELTMAWDSAPGA